jgi:hypothetical protein
MIAPKEFQSRVEVLVGKLAQDVAAFRAIFPPTVEGCIRVMLLMVYIKETLPEMFDQIDEAKSIAALWLAMDSPDESDPFKELLDQMLRDLEGTKQ